MAERNIDVRVRLRGADTFKRGMNEVSDSLGWLDTAKGILGARVVQRGFEELARAMGKSIDDSIKFETAAAALQKTANLSDQAMKGMVEQIMAMAETVPMTAADIANLADTVAHLGLAKDQILPFSRVMIALGEATDMSAEDAATALAQMANVMGTASEDYERLGSTIFELGRTSATTESAIVEMAQNMAGSAALVGMSEADVLAYAAALSSVGVEAASGATSVQKMATRFELMTRTGGEDLERFAAVAGMTAEEFASSWSEDPAKAMASFVDGLGKLDASGGSAIGVLNDLGIKEVRLVRNISGLAAANDLLDRSLTNSRKAWEDNTALAEATGIAYGTTASKLQIAQNKVQNASIAAGDYLKQVKLGYEELAAEGAVDLRKLLQSDSLAKDVGTINEKFDAVANSIQTTRDQAMDLIGSLEEMGDPTGLDASGLADYTAALNALKVLYPEIGRLYDANTGSIQGGTAALREYVEQQHNMASSANEVERSAELLEAYTQSSDKLAEAQTQEALALAALNTARTAYNKLLEDPSLKEDDIVYSKEYNAFNEAKKNYETASEAVKEYSDYLEEYSWIADDAIAASDGLADAMSATGGAMDEEAQAAEDLNRRLDAAQAEMTQIMLDYNNELETAQKSLKKVIKDPFGKMGPTKPKSVGDTKGALDSQLKYMQEYMDNLEKARELGASGDLLSALADGSEESAAVLAGIVKDNGKNIDELNEKYASVQQAKNQMTSAMADAASQASQRLSEVSGYIDSMLANTDKSGQAQANTANTMQGLINGITSKIDILRQKVAEANQVAAQLGSGGGTAPGHAAGLSYVPFDGYIAQLHRGEMVLTALEAKAYRAEQFGRYDMLPRIQQMSQVTDNRRTVEAPVTNNFNFGGITTKRESDVDRLARELNHLIRRDQRMVGA